MSNPEKLDDGGSAFPHKTYSGMNEPGISVRDFFAGLAMQGILAGALPIVKNEDPLAKVADAAYKMADAMLEARAA